MFPSINEHAEIWIIENSLKIWLSNASNYGWEIVTEPETNWPSRILVLKPLWNLYSWQTKVGVSSLMQFLLVINNWSSLAILKYSVNDQIENIKNTTWFSNMLMLEEVKAGESIAEKVFKFGGIPLISWRRSQRSKVRVDKKRHSLMHSGITVNSLPDSSKSITFTKHERNSGRSSSDSFKVRDWTLEHTTEVNFKTSSGNSLHCKLSAEIPSSSGIMQMFEMRVAASKSINWWISVPRLNHWSRVRFRNEGGSFVMGQSVKKSCVIFSIFPNISGKLLRLQQYESSSLSREVNFNCGKLLSCGQNSASKILSFSNKPTEWWIVNKFGHFLNDKFSKFERQDTSGISVKLSHSSKIKLVKFTSLCNVKRK